MRDETETWTQVCLNPKPKRFFSIILFKNGKEPEKIKLGNI